MDEIIKAKIQGYCRLAMAAVFTRFARPTSPVSLEGQICRKRFEVREELDRFRGETR